MRWQEGLIATGQVGFSVLLLPTILDPTAIVPLATSIPTAGILLTFVVAFASLRMRFAATTSAASCLAWIAVAIWRHG